MSNARVLVVDDEKAILEMVARKLTACGHECTTASDATEALDVISRNEFDLMLLAVLMPDRSGVELLIDVKDRYPDVAVVMMTGVVDTPTAVKAMREGAFDYVTKPFNLNELPTLIDRALEWRAALLQNREYHQNLERMIVERTEGLKQRMLEVTALNKILQAEITERKRAEEERSVLLEDLKELNHWLEQSNQELQDFAYVASHDLQEPLRKISAFAGLIQDSLKGKLDEDQKENLEFMVDGAQRMQMMVDALLSYSRVAIKTQLHEPVDLNELIQELRNFELASQLDETKGAVHVPEPLPPVHGDPPQIRQLLQNLIGNGLKFHREGVPPEIIIRALEVEKNMLRVEVQDNGIGIGEEYQEQVFNMFKRLHSTASYEGTGIGLAVCKKIIERHGGDIGVTSSPGKGSTFWLTLPEELLTRSSEKEGGEPWPEQK